MKNALLIAPVIGLALLAPDMADAAYMDGVLNIGPGWATITNPDGTQAGTGPEIKYDYISINSATRAALAWMAANDRPDAVLDAYSLGATGAAAARAQLPNWQGTLNLYASAAKPGNGASTKQGGMPALDVDGGAVTFISVEGDSVAFRNGSMSAHVNGYRGRDFSTETPVEVSTPGSVIDLEFDAPPKRTWAERAELRRIERQAAREERAAAREERREAREAARQERRERAQANWDRFIANLRGEDTDTADDSSASDETGTADNSPASAAGEGGDAS